MANTICNVIASYLEDLSSTHPVCSVISTTLSFNRNVFIGGCPATEIDTVTLIPYGGTPPNADGNRQNPYIQIESKTSSRYKGMGLQQALINTLHMNELNGNGLVQANQSCPIPLGTEHGGRYIIYVTNYTIKHVKVS